MPKSHEDHSLTSHPSFSKITHPFLLLSMQLHLQQTNLREECRQIIQCSAEWSEPSIAKQPALTKWNTREVESLPKAMKRAWELDLEFSCTNSVASLMSTRRTQPKVRHWFERVGVGRGRLNLPLWHETSHSSYSPLLRESYQDNSPNHLQLKTRLQSFSARSRLLQEQEFVKHFSLLFCPPGSWLDSVIFF